MKLFLLFTCLPMMAFAQLSNKERSKLNQLRYYDEIELERSYLTFYVSKKNHFKGSNVASMSSIHVENNGKEQLKYTKKYDRSGSLMEVTGQNYSKKYAYQDSLLIQVFTKEKHNTFLTKYTYDEQGRLKCKEQFENDKPTQTTTYTYYQKKLRATTERIVYGRKTHVYRLENTYDTLLHQLSKSAFLVDGEVKQLWNYACNEKGSIVDTKLETTNSQCHFEQENADGSYSKFTRTIENGKVKLTEMLFQADSTYMGYKSYEHDSILVQSYLIRGQVEEIKLYSKKGKLQFHHEFVLDEFGNQTAHRSYDKKGQRKTISTCTFNEKHLLETYQFGKKSKYRFDYTYH